MNNTTKTRTLVAVTLAGLAVVIPLTVGHDLASAVDSGTRTTYTAVGGNATIVLSSSDLAGFPPCATEDSADCYWNAAVQGNGVGYSFVDVNGVAYRAN